MKGRYTKYFLLEYSSDVYPGGPGVQVYTRISVNFRWYEKGNMVLLSPISFYVLLCWVEEKKYCLLSLFSYQLIQH